MFNGDPYERYRQTDPDRRPVGTDHYDVRRDDPLH